MNTGDRLHLDRQGEMWGVERARRPESGSRRSSGARFTKTPECAKISMVIGHEVVG